MKCHCCEKFYDAVENDYYCDFCTTMYSPSYDASIYNEEYCQRYVERSLSDLNLPLQKIRWENILKYKSTGFILDVGCGVGAFLQEVPDRHTECQWWICGFDINLDCVQYCQNNGLMVEHHSSLQEAHKSFHLKFDVITMFDALEHFEDVNEVMDQAQAMLVDGGILVVSLPNFKKEHAKNMDEWRHYRPGEHLFYLSVDSMKQLCKKHHFELLEYNFSESTIRKPPEDNIATYIMRK